MLAKWSVFAFSIVVIPIIVFLTASPKSDAPGPPALGMNDRIALCVLGVVAFTAWAAAMPGTPFLQFSENATRIGAIAVAACAAVMPRLAAALGLV